MDFDNVGYEHHETIGIDWPLELFMAGIIATLVLFLTACDGEYERLRAEADWQAKMARAATPSKGELVTIRQFADGRFVIRRYQGGLQRTDILARDE